MAAPTKKWKLIYTDPEKCVGCGVCELACSYEHEGVFSPLKSRIRIIRLNEIVNLSLTCRLCEDPPCVSACPREALTQSEETGRILVDEDKCNGCGWCIEACDFGAIVLHPEDRIAVVCDLCIDRQEKGLPPACVEWCPEEALDLVSKDGVVQRARLEATKKLFVEILRGTVTVP